MKKMFLLLTVLLFMSTTSLNAITVYAQDCEAYAQQAATAELIWLFGEEAVNQSDAVYANTLGYWQGYCEGAGGSAAQPVFIQ